MVRKQYQHGEHSANACAMNDTPRLGKRVSHVHTPFDGSILGGLRQEGDAPQLVCAESGY